MAKNKLKIKEKAEILTHENFEKKEKKKKKSAAKRNSHTPALNKFTYET